MSILDVSSVASRDVWIDHPEGRLFARVWAPKADMLSSGPDRPIVLFHDSLGCVELWRDFPARLCTATGRRVIAYDRLGFGKSDQRNDKLGMDFIAEEAKRYFPAIRAQLGFKQFIAFGHSVGGGMATNCAALFAEDCEALIAESAQFFVEDRILQGLLVAKENFKDPRRVERLKQYHGEKAEWVLNAWIGTWLHPKFASWSLAPVLPSVVCPVLAIHGDQDEYGSTRHPEMVRELSGGSVNAVIMADTFHVPHRERPEIVLDLVSRFINSVH